MKYCVNDGEYHIEDEYNKTDIGVTERSFMGLKGGSSSAYVYDYLAVSCYDTNFAMDWTSAGYKQTYEKLVTSGSNNYSYANTGSGKSCLYGKADKTATIRFKFPESTSSYTIYNATVYFWCFCTAGTNQVSIGDKYNFYGTATHQTDSASVSLSYPWGVSITPARKRTVLEASVITTITSG